MHSLYTITLVHMLKLPARGISKLILQPACLYQPCRSRTSNLNKTGASYFKAACFYRACLFTSSAAFILLCDVCLSRKGSKNAIQDFSQNAIRAGRLSSGEFFWRPVQILDVPIFVWGKKKWSFKLSCVAR
jgi:hypothetical protein